MNSYRRNLILAELGAPAATLPFSSVAQAQTVEQPNAKLTLEWAFQGQQAV